MSKDLQTMKFNFKRIHPGLGKTQSKIMDVLEEEGKIWGGMPIQFLTAKVYHSDLRGATMWMGDEYPIAKSQLNSVRRAVKSLEKRGLVKTDISSIESSKGRRRCKVVGIISERYFEEVLNGKNN